MGGDHKCPVCQATFTRPQHVARHMRSHTGDRPYKCQYCGDQFARSDLLSRHVNKCHANEKPLPPAPGGRRKGPASASRATTSKQACDQCVQSSLPCDGCNPCAKCVQRKCRCTFVKFHRQTAPSGPGHSAPPTLSSLASSLSTRPLAPPSSRYGYPAEEFILAPPPASGTSLGGLFSDTFSFPPLYDAAASTAASEGDFAAKYRAQAELLRIGGSGVTGMYSTTAQQDPRWTGTGSTTGAGTGAAGWQDGYQHPPLHHPQHHNNHHHHHEKHPSDNSSDIFTASASSSSSTSTGSSVPIAFSYRKSLDAGYSREGYGDPYGRQELEFSSSDGGSSVPSSATSSSVHLPLAAGEERPPSFQPQQQPQQPTQTDFHNAFGLMSLDDPAVLAGLSTDSAPFFSIPGAGSGDPDATPMPASDAKAGEAEKEREDMKDFWRAYMRTPLSGSGPAANNTRGTRQRVASLPSVKTPGPGVDMSRTAHEDDLKSYEAAVMARKAPVQLTFQPRLTLRRNQQGGSVGSSPQVPVARFQQQQTSSLAGVFGRPMLTPATFTQGSQSPPSRSASLGTDESNSPAPLENIKEDESLRPSFKRLPSQTLGPANSKRAFLGREEERGWGYTEDPKEEMDEEEKKPFAVISGSIAERRRRMSAPAPEQQVGYAPVGQGV